jgi:hypothetical protein
VNGKDMPNLDLLSSQARRAMRLFGALSIMQVGLGREVWNPHICPSSGEISFTGETYKDSGP